MRRIKNYIKPFANLKFIVCFCIAWMITNGWAYILFAISIACEIGWLKAVTGSYISFLYLPFTVEKLVTIPIAIFLQTKLYPKDIKLHYKLLRLNCQARHDWKEVKKCEWLKSFAYSNTINNYCLYRGGKYE